MSKAKYSKPMSMGEAARLAVHQRSGADDRREAGIRCDGGKAGCRVLRIERHIGGPRPQDAKHRGDEIIRAMEAKSGVMPGSDARIR